VRQAPVLQRRWGVNILLVEDDAADANLILTVLKRHPAVWIVRAESAPDSALAMLSSGKLCPDLVLLDIHMPRINGFEFLESLRRIRGMEDVPVVFLTTSCLARDVVAAKQSSASSYVVKPETYPDLKMQMDRVIKRVLAGEWER
jgi:CheY-like chemotaxis protein